MTFVKFRPFTETDIPLWDAWIQEPHVKDTWFIDGYEPADSIHERIRGNGYDHPFIILLDETPIGYIQACDLFAYRTLCPTPSGIFTEEAPGTFCFDLFIGESENLGKGYGTETIKAFTQLLYTHFNAKKILIDPAENNQRAIACYEKAGFTRLKKAYDGVTHCIIMEHNNEQTEH